MSGRKKRRIVLAGLDCSIEISELCRREGISPTFYPRLDVQPGTTHQGTCLTSIVFPGQVSSNWGPFDIAPGLSLAGNGIYVTFKQYINYDDCNADTGE